MKLFLVSLPALFFLTNGYAQPVQLAPPLLKYESVFFTNSAKVEMLFAEKNTAIHYTLNNKTPTENDPVYKKPLVVEGPITTVKAIASGTGFLSSDPVTVNFIQAGFPFTVISQTAPDKLYTGTGLSTLSDNNGGSTNIHGGTWLGYKTDSIKIELQLLKKESLRFVAVHCLKDYGSWIFLPESIEVSWPTGKNDRYKSGGKFYYDAAKYDYGSCVPLIYILPKNVKTEKLKIIIKGVQSIPDDHPGKGQKGWLFIDEIKLY